MKKNQNVDPPSPSGAIIYLILFLFTALMAYNDHQYALHSKPTPTVISAKDLALNGVPNDNWFITITDFTVQDVTLQERNGKLNYVNFRLFPDPPISSQGREIIVGENVQSEDDVAQATGQKTITGLAHPPVFSLGGFEANRVDVWMQSSSRSQVNIMLYVAAAFLLGGAISLIRFLKLKSSFQPPPMVQLQPEAAEFKRGGLGIGCLFFFGGLVLAKFAVWDPLEALKHHQSPDLNETYILILPFLLLYGLYGIVLNNRMVTKDNRPTKTLLILCAFSVAMGFALKAWMISEFERYGCHITRF